MPTEMNFQRGVDYKATPKAASSAAAEKGEAGKAQENFNWTKEPCKDEHAPYPETKPQLNFPN